MIKLERVEPDKDKEFWYNDEIRIVMGYSDTWEKAEKRLLDFLIELRGTVLVGEEDLQEIVKKKQEAEK